MMRMLCVAWILFPTGGVWAAPGNYYLLPQLAYVSVNLQHVTPLYAVGLAYGWRLGNNVSVAGEINRSVSGGTFTERDPTGRETGTGRYQLQTFAGYGVYRVPLISGIYAKAKTGLVYERVFRLATQDNGHAARVGLSMGAGFGYAVNHALTLELDLTGVEQDLMMLLLGVHYYWP